MPKSILDKLRGRIRHGLLTQELLDGLSGLGITIYPYIVFREIVDAKAPILSGMDDFSSRQLDASDAEKIASIEERPRKAQEVLNRLTRGDIGVGAYDGDRIVGYSWCDMHQFRGLGRGVVMRKLAPDEAYLYDAYTLPAYRGRGLAQYLRVQLYQVIGGEGKKLLYSISLYFNRSARRFKQKLGAEEIEIRLVLQLAGRWRHDRLLRRPHDGPNAGLD